MKLTNNSLLTSTELLEEFFGMNRKFIYRLPEKQRYKKIYEYLMQQTEAKKLGNKETDHQLYTIFSWQEDIYLIPENIFDKFDEEWKEKIKTDREEAGLC